MRARFLTVNNFVNSIAAALSPILGGKFADILTQYELSWSMTWTGPSKVISFETLNFQSWDFFFASAFIVGLYAMHRLSLVKEEGEVDEKIVFDGLMAETRKQLQNFTTIGGMRQMVNFPYTAFRYVTIKGKRKISQATNSTKNFFNKERFDRSEK